MGGSTNTVLHLLAAAHEGEIPFTMKDIDRLSRKVPVLCKVAPSVADVHMEDVHRAGGVMAILGELDRAGLIHAELPSVHSSSLKTALERWDISRTQSESVRNFYKAAPGGVPTQAAFSQQRRFEELDTDRAAGCIRDAEHAFSKDGGLAVLYGNLALDGCIVKTAGVDASILKFAGTARVCESQDAAVEAILTNKIKPGDIVVVIYEGPRGGPGMQEMLYPTSYLKSKGLGQSLRAGHRWTLLRRLIGSVDRPCLAGSRRRRTDRPGKGWRPHRDRYSCPLDPSCGRRGRAEAATRGDGSQGRAGLEAGQARPQGFDRA